MPTRKISRAIRRPRGTDSQELRPASESASLIDFLTVIQKQNVTILPLSYNKGLAILGRGLAGVIQQSTADATTSLAFKEGVPSKHEYDTEQEQDWYSLLTEIVILQHPTIQKNPHFVDLIGVSFYVEPCGGIEKWRAWPLLVTRKANMGDLNSVLRDVSQSFLTDLIRLQLFAEIAEALHVLHSCGVAHGDIKPGNILVETQESEINCMLIDFGSSVIRGQIRLPTTDEPWSAPELNGHVESRGYEEVAQTDIFACGLVLVHLLLPLDALQRKDLCLVRQPGQTDEQWTDLIGKIVRMKRSDGGKTLGARIMEVVEICSNSEERKGIIRDVVTSMICARAGERSLPWGKILPHIEMFLSRSLENDKIEPASSPPLAFNSPSLGHPDHVKFNLAEALGELDDVDYVLRANITQDIIRKANGSVCEACKKDHTFQLAMCHAIGFGCTRDVTSVQTLLSQSDRSQIDLDEAIKNISSTYRVPGNVDGTVLESFGIGVLVSSERSQEYQVSRRLEIAERSVRAEIQGREGAFGEHHCCNAKLRSELALVLKAQGRLKDAQCYQQGAVDVLTKSLGERHPSALLANIVLADILSEQGLLHQAVELHYKVQPILSETLGPEHPETITAQQILANTAALLGQYNQAEKICRGVVDARTKMLSPMHPLTLRAQLNLVSMLRAQGMLFEASSIMKDVENLFHDTLAGDDLTNIHLNMVRAMLCKDLILLEQAYECVKGATHTLDRLNLPENDPLRLSTLEILASVHRENEDWKNEEAVLRQVLHAKGLFDDTHERNRDHYTTKCLLVDSLLSQFKLDDAEALAKQILASHIQSIDADPENFISCERALAKVLSYRGQRGLAETRYQNLLSSCKSHLGVDNPLTYNVTYSLGKFLADQGLYNEAQIHYNATLQHLRNTSRLGKDAFEVARHLSIAYKEAGQFKQACEICKEGIGWATATMSAEHAETLDLYNTLVDIYTQMGQLDKAEDLHQTHLETQCQGTYMEIWVKDHLARLRKAQGRHEEARALKIEAHQMILQRRGNMHPDVLKMGEFLLQEKMSSGVLSNEVVNEVLGFINLKKQVFGEHHPSVLHTKSDLAYAFASNERLDEAEKLFHEIIEFDGAARIQNPQLHASLLAKMAEVQFRKSNLEKAEEFERRGLELRQRIFGDGHRLVLLSMSNLSSTLHARGEEREAEKYLRLVVAGYEQFATSDNGELIFRYLKSRIALAAVLYSQNVPQHAEELIELYTTTIHAATLVGLPIEIVTIWEADLNHVLQDVSASDTVTKLPV